MFALGGFRVGRVQGALAAQLRQFATRQYAGAASLSLLDPALYMKFHHLSGPRVCRNLTTVPFLSPTLLSHRKLRIDMHGADQSTGMLSLACQYGPVNRIS